MTVGGVKLEAANEGSWSANLRASVDKEGVSNEVAIALGVTKEDLFNLTVRNASSGGAIERFINLTVKESARRIDRGLKAESALVLWEGVLDPSVPPVIVSASDSVTTAETDLVMAKKALTDKLIANPAAEVETEEQMVKDEQKKVDDFQMGDFRLIPMRIATGDIE